METTSQNEIISTRSIISKKTTNNDLLTTSSSFFNKTDNFSTKQWSTNDNLNETFFVSFESTTFDTLTEKTTNTNRLISTMFISSTISELTTKSDLSSTSFVNKNENNEFLGQYYIKLTGHTGRINSLVELKNGYLASGSDDRTIRIWDVENEKTLSILTGHSNQVFI